MPHARFYKLAAAKREGLLEIAAQEFATHGFAQASINQILERAQMSKGTAYYYFEDKIDLFCAVVSYCSERLNLIDQAVDVATLTATTFWPTFAMLHRQPLVRSFAAPWLFAALHAAGRLPPAALAREPLATLAARLKSWVAAIIKQGQALGVITTTIADELIFAWLDAIDEASDQWLLAHWAELDQDAITRISDETVAAMRRMLAPEAAPENIATQ